ncbi:MAG: transposase [Firmicutes bacterium]|nr:transposase [Bacillota bacterium]
MFRCFSSAVSKMGAKYLANLINSSSILLKTFQEFLTTYGVQSKEISKRSPWQNPYAERVIGILRQELLNHIIPLNEKHLERLLQEYIHCYYNTDRTHQGIDGQTPILSPAYQPTTATETNLKSTPILNGLYHTIKKLLNNSI